MFRCHDISDMGHILRGGNSIKLHNIFQIISKLFKRFSSLTSFIGTPGGKTSSKSVVGDDVEENIEFIKSSTLSVDARRAIRLNIIIIILLLIIFFINFYDLFR